MKPAPVLTGYVAPALLRAGFRRGECVTLDASEFIAAGSVSVGYGGPVTALADRSALDAYEQTDRTAVHTDCASVPV